MLEMKRSSGARPSIAGAAHLATDLDVVGVKMKDQIGKDNGRLLIR